MNKSNQQINKNYLTNKQQRTASKVLGKRGSKKQWKSSKSKVFIFGVFIFDIFL